MAIAYSARGLICSSVRHGFPFISSGKRTSSSSPSGLHISMVSCIGIFFSIIVKGDSAMGATSPFRSGCPDIIYVSGVTTPSTAHFPSPRIALIIIVSFWGAFGSLEYITPPAAASTIVTTPTDMTISYS